MSASLPPRRTVCGECGHPVEWLGEPPMDYPPEKCDECGHEFQGFPP